ncbi:MAG: DUF4333 domain-containing protein [Polyangiales bacterium]
MRTKLAVLAVAVTSSLALVACSLNKTKLENSIKDDVKDKGWPVKGVTCPDGKKQKPNEKFDCTIDFDDEQKLTVHVEVIDFNGTVNWAQDKDYKVYEMDEVVSDMEDKIGAKVDGDVKVKCKKYEKVAVLKKGDKFDCTAKAGDTKIAIKAKVKDGNGNYEYDWKQIE